MFGAKLKSTVLAIAAAAMWVGIGTAPANAVPITWDLNLSLIGGKNIKNINYIAVTGQSQVTQNFSGGAPSGGFVDSGYLIMDRAFFASGAPASKNVAGFLPDPADGLLFVRFSNLTGQYHAISNTITFDPYTTPGYLGSISLVYDPDGSMSGLDQITLANFGLVTPSGGIFPKNFFGGFGPDGTVDLTALEISSAYPGLYSVNGGGILPPFAALHLTNVNADLQGTTPSPIPPGYTGPVIADITNGGRYSLGTVPVPEPGTLGLLGLGLLAAGYVTRRRKSA